MFKEFPSDELRIGWGYGLVHFASEHPVYAHRVLRSGLRAVAPTRHNHSVFPLVCLPVVLGTLVPGVCPKVFSALRHKEQKVRFKFPMAPNTQTREHRPAEDKCILYSRDFQNLRKESQ